MSEIWITEAMLSEMTKFLQVVRNAEGDPSLVLQAKNCWSDDESISYIIVGVSRVTEVINFQKILVNDAVLYVSTSAADGIIQVLKNDGAVLMLRHIGNLEIVVKSHIEYSRSPAVEQGALLLGAIQ